MNAASTEKLLIRLIREQRGEDTNVSMKVALEDLGYESFSFIELVLSIEDQLGIEFEDRYLSYREFETVGDLLAYTRLLVAARKRTAVGGR